MGIFNNFAAGVKKVWRDTRSSSLAVVFGGKRLDLSTKRQLLEYQGLVATCVDLIAREVAKYSPIAYSNRKTDAKPQDHPFLNILDSPNPQTSKFDFLVAHESNLLLTGDSFWLVSYGENTGRPRQINILRPDLVEVIVDTESDSEQGGQTVGYIYRPNIYTEIPLDLTEVIHFKSYNPLSDTRGMGAITKYQLYIEIEQNIAEFQNGFMKNQATPSGVLEIKSKISEENFARLKKQWSEAHAGTGNTGKTLFIRNSEVSFQKIGLAINELALENIKPLAKEDVLEAFGVPAALLGRSDSSGLGRSNIETIEYNFAKRNIDSRYTLLDSGIERFIRLAYRDQYTTIKHVSDIPKDKDHILAEKIASVGKWRTVNEIRALESLPAVEGGDKLYSQYNQVPIDSDSTLAAAKGHVIVTTKKAEPGQINLHDVFQKIVKKGSKQYRQPLVTYLNIQEQAVVDQAANLFKSAKSIESILDIILTDNGAAYVELGEGLLGVLIQVIENAGKTALDYFGLPDSQFVIDQAQRDSIFSSTDRLLKSYNQQTAQKIQSQVAQALANSESVEQLTNRIKMVYDEATDARAKAIAISEVHEAVNYGAAEGYKSEGYRQMIWRALPNACEFCASMEGKIVSIGSPFIVEGSTVAGTDGGEYIADYQNIAYANLHPHCDCWLEPVQATKGVKPNPITHTIKAIEEVKLKIKLLEDQASQPPVITENTINQKVKDIADDIFAKLEEKTTKKMSEIEDKIIQSI